jgi:hypothetical protein
LARPCISYPEIFARGTIWDRYPYLLPNLFSACTVFVGVIVGVLFLEETHVAKRNQRDRGREVGDYIVSKCPSIRGFTCRERTPEKQGLLHEETACAGDNSDDEDLPRYQSNSSSPKMTPRSEPETQDSQAYEAVEAPPTKIFTRPVIMNIVSYGILAL